MNLCVTSQKLQFLGMRFHVDGHSTVCLCFAAVYTFVIVLIVQAEWRGRDVRSLLAQQGTIGVTTDSGWHLISLQEGCSGLACGKYCIHCGAYCITHVNTICQLYHPLEQPLYTQMISQWEKCTVLDLSDEYHLSFSPDTQQRVLTAS